MRRRKFVQVDVFASRPAKGNGLAVVVEAEGLTTDEMQGFAAWTNLAETSFLLPPEAPGADYRVRIFTPGREMPFAGHPTLGSCAAWLHCGGQPQSPTRVMQDCAIGVVEIDLTADPPGFVAPPTAVAPLPAADLARCCSRAGARPLRRPPLGAARQRAGLAGAGTRQRRGGAGGGCIIWCAGRNSAGSR